MQRRGPFAPGPVLITGGCSHVMPGNGRRICDTSQRCIMDRVVCSFYTFFGGRVTESHLGCEQWLRFPVNVSVKDRAKEKDR